MPVGDGDDPPLSLSHLPVPQHSPGAWAVQPQAHPVSRQHLGSVLVLDLDDAGRLDPGFSIYLHRDALIPPDSDLHHAALWGEQPRVGIMVGSVLLPSAAVLGLKRFPMPVPARSSAECPKSCLAPPDSHGLPCLYLRDAVVLEIDDP